MRVIAVEEAVGTVLCHDITRIVPGESKGPAFRKGHVVRPEDVSELLRLGKEHLYVAQTQHSCHQVSSSFEQVSGCQGHDKYIKNFSLLYRAWRFCAGGRCPSPCSC